MALQDNCGASIRDSTGGSDLRWRHYLLDTERNDVVHGFFIGRPAIAGYLLSSRGMNFAALLL